MRSHNPVDDDPRQAVHALLREWVNTLRDRDSWSGTYAAFADELHTILATTRGDLAHIAKFVTAADMALAPVLVDAASTFTSLGWLVGIADHKVYFSRSS